MKTNFSFKSIKSKIIKPNSKDLKMIFANKSYLYHFLWNLKFKFFTKINYFLSGLIVFLSFLFAFLAAHSINIATASSSKSSISFALLPVLLIFIIFISIVFLIISTSSHTSEEKNSRAMEIILSSVGVKYHWFVKLATNFIWFISLFVGMILIGSIASFIAGITILGHFVFSGGMIIDWILGYSAQMKDMINNHNSITFKHFWILSDSAHGYDFFVTMIFLTIAVNGLIYSILTLSLSSFIVNSNESILIVLIILLFPIVFSVILGIIWQNNPAALKNFLCYFPLTSIYQIPSVLFETSKNPLTGMPENTTSQTIIWTAILVNIFYVFFSYYFFRKLYIVGVLNYSSNQKLFSRIFSLKKIKKNQQN